MNNPTDTQQGQQTARVDEGVRAALSKLVESAGLMLAEIDTCGHEVDPAYRLHLYEAWEQGKAALSAQLATNPSEISSKLVDGDQPAQAVDVGAAREVIAELQDKADAPALLRAQLLADKLTRAIGTAQEGWLDAERKASPEHQTDMLMARMVLREVIVPPAPTPPTDGEG